MTQHEKHSQAAMAHLRSNLDTYRQTDHGKRIAERDAIDRKAEFVGRLGAFGLGLAALAVLFLATS